MNLTGIEKKGSPDFKFQFQGQKKQEEFGLNWSSFKWRNADVQLGRFHSVDPLAEDYVYNSTYAFSENKVVADIELEGLESTDFKDLKLGNVGRGFIKAGEQLGINTVINAISEGFQSTSKALQNYASKDGNDALDIGTDASDIKAHTEYNGAVEMNSAKDGRGQVRTGEMTKNSEGGKDIQNGFDALSASKTETGKFAPSFTPEKKDLSIFVEISNKLFGGVIFDGGEAKKDTILHKNSLYNGYTLGDTAYDVINGQPVPTDVRGEDGNLHRIKN